MPTLALSTGPTVFYKDTGGTGVPLIFSHGLFMDHSMFGPQLAAFSAHWRCIAWDERAHGGTPWTGDFTFWDSAKDLLALMDALKIESAIHIGMSQGGLLGMRAAMLAPKRFHGIVQLATQAGTLDEEAIGPFKDLMRGWIENGSDSAILQFLTDLILGPGVDTRYWHNAWKRMPPAHIRSALSALYSIDELYARLGEVTVPLATIHGLADVSTPYPLAVRVHQEVPDAREMTLIEDGPHAVNLTHPDRVNTAIATFLAELCRENPGIHHATR